MIQWANLWKWAVMLPGTRWARVWLTVWQLGLVTVPTLGYATWGWWGMVGGVVGGFFAHEVFFIAYAKVVARTPAMDDGDVVGVAHRADYTYERWIGPVV